MRCSQLAGAASCDEGGDGGGSPVEPNRAPVAAGVIPPQTMIMGESASVNVSSYFNDPDGDMLTYTAATSSAAVAGVSVHAEVDRGGGSGDRDGDGDGARSRAP